MGKTRDELLLACDLALTHKTFAYNSFIEGLTERQYQAYMRRKAIPKGLGHVRRYQAYTDALEAHRALKNRLGFELIIGGRVI